MRSDFPITYEETIRIAGAEELAISVHSEEYPAYAIRIDGDNTAKISSFIFKVWEAFIIGE
jgi:hypothetical protein